MSFATTTKNEITTLTYNKSDVIALLSGFIRNNGTVENDTLYLTTENDLIASLLNKHITNIYNVKVSIEKTNNHNLFKNKLNLIKINEKTSYILQDIGYFDKNNNYLDIPPVYIVDANSEIRSYLRGVFLSSGSINDPNSSYHMELSISLGDEAVFVQKLLNIFDLNAKILSRERGYMIYIKEAEKISDYLKILGANKAVMDYESVRVYHDEKNKTNRLNNCEQANTDRIILTATKQIEQIEYLKENKKLDLLDDKTKELVEYRLKYPESSLQELSEIISLETRKPITKSGLNHRFRKISALYDRLKKNA